MVISSAPPLPTSPEVGILEAPPPLVVLWNDRVSGNFNFNLRAAMRCRENLEKKASFKVSKTSARELLADHGSPEWETTLRPPRDSPRGKGQGRFPTVRFSKIVGSSYGYIQSPQRSLSPWRQATIVATLNSQKMIKDVGVGGHGTA